MAGIIERITGEILREIQRSFEFYRSATGSENIDRIVLGGGCSKMKGIDQFLSEKINIPVEVINPFKRVRFNEKVFDKDYIKEMAPLAAVGIGLASRRLEDR